MNPILRALRQKEVELSATLSKLNEEAGANPFTEDQLAEFEKATADLEATRTRCEQIEQTERAVQASSIATAALVEPSIEMGNDNAVDAPWSPDGNARMGFAQFLQAVHQADPRVNGIVDPRLNQGAAVSGTNQTIGSEGGFLVGTDQTTDLNRVMFESAQLASRCQNVEIGPNSNSISTRMIAETSRAAGSRWGGVTVGWAAEGDTVDSSKPAFRLVDQKLSKMIGLWYCTEEELADVNYIASVGANAFGEEMAFVLDEAIYRGIGGGIPLGMLISDALVQVAKEDGQEADSIYWENVKKMFARMPASSMLRAVWLANPDTMPQLMDMSMVNGTAGTPVFLPPTGAAEAPFGTLFGRPLIPNEHSSTVGDLGDLIFSDLGWYRIIKKGGVNAASSIHVRFIYDEQTFKFTFRVNGQPMLTSAITPAQGTATVSPFVALAERA